MKKHTQTFEAVDEDGNAHTLHLFVDHIDAGHFGDPNAKTEGAKSLKTVEGKNVNRVSKGVYELVGVGRRVRLTSDDPQAP